MLRPRSGTWKLTLLFLTSAYVNLRLGDVALRRGQAEEAFTYFATASGPKPEGPCMPLIIWEHGTTGNMNTKVHEKWLLDALAQGLEPDYWFYEILADSYWHLGDCQRALESYQSFLQDLP